MDLAAIDAVVARVVSTEYIFQLGFMLVVPVLLVGAWLVRFFLWASAGVDSLLVAIGRACRVNGPGGEVV